ncbi:MAG: ABC transporter permease [Clostridia bacterium]|nr:ABC transporter permease [Clostridia bacterium]
MKQNKAKKSEPLIRITKRTDVSLKLGIIVRVIAILIALLVCGIVTKVFTSDDPISILKTIVHGAFGEGRMLVTLHDVALLLCVSLAVTPAFRMKFWNIGAEGQVLMGALATAMCMFFLGGKVPDALLIVIMIVFSIVTACVWAIIPAFFKAHWGTNETLFTLMMNYVAIQLIEYFLKIADKSGSNVVGPDLLSHGWFPQIFHTDYVLNIVIVAIITVLLHIYLTKSKHGYELLVVGESENTARYIGINVKKVIIRTMALSGAICGIAGLLIVGGASHSIDSNIAGGRGFSAIMVSWLAKFNPIVMVLTSLLLVFLSRGADEVSSKFGLNADFSQILTGIILFFIIGCEFFIHYQVHFRSSKKAEKEDK